MIKLGLAGTDVGGGWLIFNAPEADLGVHPAGDAEPPSGLVTYFKVPGGFNVQLYQPKYAK